MFYIQTNYLNNMKKIAFLIVAVAIGFASCEKDDSVFTIDEMNNVSNVDGASNSNNSVYQGKADSDDEQNNLVFTDDETYDNKPTKRDQEAF